MPIIRVPSPATESFNKHRPISVLLLSRLKHFYEAEIQLPTRYHTHQAIDGIKTEAEASAYIRAVTANLRSRVTISIPKPAHTAFQGHRPLSELLKHQIQHFSELERRLPIESRAPANIGSIHTEADASRYIMHISLALKQAAKET